MGSDTVSGRRGRARRSGIRRSWVSCQVGAAIIGGLGIVDDQLDLDVAAGMGEPDLSIVKLALNRSVVLTNLAADVVAGEAILPGALIKDPGCERVVGEDSSNEALIWLDPTRVSAFGKQREVAARDDVGPTRRILARINAVGDASVLRKHRRHDVAHVTGLRQAGLR
jgi:hypothetical protein